MKDEALQTARNCRHFAMCKVDFLGSGVCEAGLKYHYVSFYPQGRMDLYAALSDHTAPVTAKCVEIAQSCNLCGRCDYQCYYVNELRPSKVMKALKDYIAAYLKNGGRIVPVPDDDLLREIRGIVGEFWATNDPAIKIAYHHDLCPHAVFKMPEYVIMPGTKEELSSVVQLLHTNGIPYVVRGNGASSHGLVFSEGAVLDLNRMKTMEFDEKNWCVKVGPGVASFDLQAAARQRGYRVHTAEPAANVCANLMTSGLLSTFSTTYGIAADNFVDAEFMAKDGSIFSLNDRRAPNLLAFDQALAEHPPEAICVSACVKLHPVTEDEEGVLVPFTSLEDAFAFAKECAEIYSRPEMSDLVWLNTFRIQSARFGREKPFVGLVCYLPAEIGLITEMQGALGKIADKYQLKNELGFITPFESGKRCIWEYDFYFDHNNPAELDRIQRATIDAGELLDDFSRRTGTVKQVRYVVNQGCCRKENLLYT